ncbi:SRPBCC family protein [Dermatophilaceae bacterium Soc4.6]
MPTVSRTFTVTPPPQQVLDYLADFGNAPQWDPGTETCRQNGAGPVEVGTSWHNVSTVVGVTTELTYTLREKAPDHIVLVGENDSSTSTDTITVVPVGTGSEITYTAELEMHGAAKLATPVMKLVFEKLASDTEEQMTTVLNALPSA